MVAQLRGRARSEPAVERKKAGRVIAPSGFFVYCAYRLVRD
jgi:hypothetical protein